MVAKEKFAHGCGRETRKSRRPRLGIVSFLWMGVWKVRVVANGETKWEGSFLQSGRLSLNCLDKMGVTLCEQSRAREVRGQRGFCSSEQSSLQSSSDQQCSEFRLWWRFSRTVNSRDQDAKVCLKPVSVACIACKDYCSERTKHHSPNSDQKNL